MLRFHAWFVLTSTYYICNPITKYFVIHCVGF